MSKPAPHTIYGDGKRDYANCPACIRLRELDIFGGNEIRVMHDEEETKAVAHGIKPGAE